MKEKKETSVQPTLSEADEYKFVKLMIEDANTYVAYHKWIDPLFFNIAPIREILRIMAAFYETKTYPASYEDIKYQVEMCNKAAKAKGEIQEAFKYIRSLSIDNGMDSLKEYCLQYIKKKGVAKICEKLIKDFNEKPYTEELMDNAISNLTDIHKTNIDKNRIIGGEELMRMMCNVEIDSRILFGIKELDEHIGGLPKKSVNLLVAPTGVGKTTFLCMYAMRAACQGYKVAHIFFEDNNYDIGAKYFASLFHIDTKSFINNRELLRNIWQNPDNKQFTDAITNNIKQIKMEIGETSVGDIKLKVLEMISGGFRPDLLIIDYMGCLKLSSNKVMALEKEWQLLERETKKLEAMANELNLCIMTAQQTNRDGSKEDTANNRVGNIQGSYRMLQPCSYVFYLTKVNDGSGDINKASLYLDKSRGCPKRAWENIYFNNGTCEMDLSGATVKDNLPSFYDDNEDDDINHIKGWRVQQ